MQLRLQLLSSTISAQANAVEIKARKCRGLNDFNGIWGYTLLDV